MIPPCEYFLSVEMPSHLAILRDEYLHNQTSSSAVFHTDIFNPNVTFMQIWYVLFPTCSYRYPCSLAIYWELMYHGFRQLHNLSIFAAFVFLFEVYYHDINAAVSFILSAFSLQHTIVFQIILEWYLQLVSLCEDQ